MTEVILVKVIQTCAACPSQWDAWDADGHYWYLRYRHSHGRADRQPSPDWRTWSDDPPSITFDAEDGDADGWIDLRRFLQRTGLNLHPEADVRQYDDDAEYERAGG